MPGSSKMRKRACPAPAGVGSTALLLSAERIDCWFQTTEQKVTGQTIAQWLDAFAQTLPAFAQTLPAFAQTLPAFAQTLPAFAQTLPAFAQTLPAFAQTLPAFAQTLPAFAQTLPAFAQTLPALSVHRPTVVVLDNASIHQGKEVKRCRKRWEETRALRVLPAALRAPPQPRRDTLAKTQVRVAPGKRLPRQRDTLLSGLASTGRRRANPQHTLCPLQKPRRKPTPKCKLNTLRYLIP